MKIAVAGIHGLSNDQTNRLKSLGDATFFEETLKTKEEKLAQLKDADIICGETEFVMDVIYELKEKMISFPFVGVGFMDLDRMAKNNVKIANAPGCNKSAVSEWIVAMLLILSRKFMKYIGTKEIAKGDFMEPTQGLAGKKITILGKGNIGSKVGKICETLDMKVTHFDKGDNLSESVQDADFIVNALSHNKETEGMLNETFFASLKDEVFFVSITDTEIYDKNALIQFIDSGKIAGAAIDPAGAGVFDSSNNFYQELLSHPKILVTPHIAFHSDMTTKIANDIMIDNVEAWTKDTPQNIVN
jgi:phosphoglycerate dehydrogenase-like enzyme